MQLPEHLSMKNTKHGHGPQGLAFYRYEDAGGLGILLDVRRQSAGERFVETWRFRWLPEGEFRTYEALRAAVAELTDEALAAERAKWPQMPEPPAPSSGNSDCWLHPDRKATHRAWVQTCWHRFDGLTALLCAQCGAAAATDPTVVVRASDARKAYVASLPPLLERLQQEPSRA